MLIQLLYCHYNLTTITHQPTVTNTAVNNIIITRRKRTQSWYRDSGSARRQTSTKLWKCFENVRWYSSNDGWQLDDLGLESVTHMQITPTTVGLQQISGENEKKLDKVCSPHVHWLPLRQSVELKVATLVHQAMSRHLVDNWKGEIKLNWN